MKIVSKRLLLWVALGFPIYVINYGLFLVFFGVTGSVDIAYWSWIIASPVTLRMWDFLDLKCKGLVV